MHLQNNIKNRTHQDLIDIPLYNLEVNQEREVVYKQGQDITVNVSSLVDRTFYFHPLCFFKLF